MILQVAPINGRKQMGLPGVIFSPPKKLMELFHPTALLKSARCRLCRSLRSLYSRSRQVVHQKCCFTGKPTDRTWCLDFQGLCKLKQKHLSKPPVMIAIYSNDICVKPSKETLIVKPVHLHLSGQHDVFKLGCFPSLQS